MFLILHVIPWVNELYGPLLVLTPVFVDVGIFISGQRSRVWRCDVVKNWLWMWPLYNGSWEVFEPTSGALCEFLFYQHLNCALMSVRYQICIRILSETCYSPFQQMRIWLDAWQWYQQEFSLRVHTLYLNAWVGTADQVPLITFAMQ